ncbi:hypothetical protein PRN20_13035 [Devosia sp. ZB163]|uniref:hypothetical protein n=1 Tax=Devosia sp. ZB163 TaxID=3025938 RepID=UPI00236255FE|nr:hypothetical protein [Devosia sp. ZB163]MDC9824659.1 hypothetical protein [Devosia sp. ZB163]
MEAWSDFFLGELGAAGALAGLLVVAMSINIERILATPSLPRRAAQTLIVIGGALVISSFALFPGQPLWVFGWEVLAVGGAIGASGLVHLPRALAGLKRGEPLTWTLTPLTLVAVATLPMLVGAVFLIAGDASGLYWVATAVIFCMIAALLNGWVLLVEILR